ncbi:hypothetical protein LEMLEM_LOCUS4524 [Lemmus lemmus]
MLWSTRGRSPMPAAGVSADSHSLGTCTAMSASSTMASSSPCWCEVFFCIPQGGRRDTARVSWVGL